jgi:hypothetical protein
LDVPCTLWTMERLLGSRTADPLKWAEIPDPMGFLSSL